MPAFEKIIESFKRYYDVSTENIEKPFAAEAVFKSHNEQYFLLKIAKVADIDSNEFVFFYDAVSAQNAVHESESAGEAERKIECKIESGLSSEKFSSEKLSLEKVRELAQTAWQRGLERIKPYYGHRNTDVSLIIICNKFSDEVFKKAGKIHFYKSYKLGFYGWSSFRLLIFENTTGRYVTNRRGAYLKKNYIKSLKRRLFK